MAEHIDAPWAFFTDMMDVAHWVKLNVRHTLKCQSVVLTC